MRVVSCGIPHRRGLLEMRRTICFAATRAAVCDRWRVTEPSSGPGPHLSRPGMIACRTTPRDTTRRAVGSTWITTTGEITVRHQTAGQQASIDLSRPPLVPGSVVVGKFHTHPNPSSEGWTPGPSRRDRQVDALHGVPDLIRADDGVHVSGPESRRGLAHGPGFPP